MYIVTGTFSEAVRFAASLDRDIRDWDFRADDGPLRVYRRLSADEMRQLAAGDEVPPVPMIESSLVDTQSVDMWDVLKSHGVVGAESRTNESFLIKLDWKNGQTVLPSKLAEIQDEIRALTGLPYRVVDHLPPFDWDQVAESGSSSDSS